MERPVGTELGLLEDRTQIKRMWKDHISLHIVERLPNVYELTLRALLGIGPIFVQTITLNI